MLLSGTDRVTLSNSIVSALGSFLMFAPCQRSVFTRLPCVRIQYPRVSHAAVKLGLFRVMDIIGLLLLSARTIVLAHVSPDCTQRTLRYLLQRVPACAHRLRKLRDGDRVFIAQILRAPAHAEGVEVRIAFLQLAQDG